MLNSKYLPIFALYILYNLVNVSSAPLAETRGSIVPIRVEEKDGKLDLTLDVRLNVKEDNSTPSPVPNLNGINLKLLCTYVKNLCQNQYDSWGKRR